MNILLKDIYAMLKNVMSSKLNWNFLCYDYLIKLEETTLNYLSSVTEPVILEFGVRHGESTKYFLNFCEKNTKLF